MRKPGPRMNDPYLLRRFVDAQQPVYGRVLAELRQGRKRSHWMWFIFPQIRGLGHSAVATNLRFPRARKPGHTGASALGKAAERMHQLVTK